MPQNRVSFAGLRAAFLGIASFLLAYVSIILSYTIITHFCYLVLHFSLNNPDNTSGPTWRLFVFQITQPAPIAFLFGWIGIGAAAGGLGYWLARRRQEATGRLRASAARFSIWGLVGVAIDLIIIASLLGYRAYRFFFG